MLRTLMRGESETYGRLIINAAYQTAMMRLLAVSTTTSACSCDVRPWQA